MKIKLILNIFFILSFLSFLIFCIFNYGLPRRIAEINFGQRLFCLSLTLFFFTLFLLVFEYLYFLYIVYYFGYAKPNYFNFMVKIHEILESNITPLIVLSYPLRPKFYGIILQFVPVRIFVFFFRNILKIFHIDQIKFLVIIFDVLPHLIVCNLLALDIIISKEISSFYNFFILLLIPLIFREIITILWYIQRGVEKTLIDNVVEISQKNEKDTTLFSYKFKGKYIGKDIEYFGLNVVHPIMEFKRIFAHYAMMKDEVCKIPYLYIYLVYTLCWGQLTYVHLINI